MQPNLVGRSGHNTNRASVITGSVIDFGWLASRSALVAGRRWGRWRRPCPSVAGKRRAVPRRPTWRPTRDAAPISAIERKPDSIQSRHTTRLRGLGFPMVVIPIGVYHYHHTSGIQATAWSWSPARSIEIIQIAESVSVLGCELRSPLPGVAARSNRSTSGIALRQAPSLRGPKKPRNRSCQRKKPG